MVEEKTKYDCSVCVQCITGNCYSECVGKQAYESGNKAAYSAIAEQRLPDGVVTFYEYKEFEVWRMTHKTHRDPGGEMLRCPRCFSTKIKRVGDIMTCQGCRFSEHLIDFPRRD